VVGCTTSAKNSLGFDVDDNVIRSFVELGAMAVIWYAIGQLYMYGTQKLIGFMVRWKCRAEK
jgi:hypothetical protein